MFQLKRFASAYLALHLIAIISLAASIPNTQIFETKLISYEIDTNFAEELDDEKIVRFYQQVYVTPGHSVYVTGNISALGSWDPKLALKLNRSGDNNWEGEVYVPIPGTFEYKYIIADENKENVRHDQRPNAKMTLSDDPITLLLTGNEDIRVMTFNIRYQNDIDGHNGWEYRKDHASEIMNRYASDFIGLQEALPGQIADVQNRLPNYLHYGTGRDVGGGGEATPIYYLHQKWNLEAAKKFWLSDTPDVEGSKSYGNGIPRICTWGKFRNIQSQEIFYVYNCHLDHESKISREKSAIQIKKHIDTNCVGTKNVILMGDLNSYYPRLVESTLGTMISEGREFRDTCLGWFEIFQGTFHWWTGIGLVRLDYVFVPRDWAVTDYAIIRESRNGVYPSDHFPVMTQFNPYKNN